MKNYGKTAWPFAQLLKKDKFSRGKETQIAFEQLKTATNSLPILVVPCFKKTFIIKSNASR